MAGKKKRIAQTKKIRTPPKKSSVRNDENMITWHKINDPVHKTMCFSQDEKNLIHPFLDNQLFQRLRNIKQMGLANLVFPGAVHTRFSHSLGACYLACHILGNIKGKSKEFNSKEKAFILAALLHDIGHGPFSHAFEEIFKDENGKKIVTHEDWSDEFIEYLFTKDQQLKEDYKRLNKISTAKANNELHEIFNEIKEIFHPKSGVKNYYSDLISSQLDVDRMDYLVRDSHFCGVEYGTYDVDWLVDSITVSKDQNGTKKLCLTPKGIGVAENLRLYTNKGGTLTKIS